MNKKTKFQREIDKAESRLSQLEYERLNVKSKHELIGLIALYKERWNAKSELADSRAVLMALPTFKNETKKGDK